MVSMKITKIYCFCHRNCYKFLAFVVHYQNRGGWFCLLWLATVANWPPKTVTDQHAESAIQQVQLPLASNTRQPMVWGRFCQRGLTWQNLSQPAHSAVQTLLLLKSNLILQFSSLSPGCLNSHIWKLTKMEFEDSPLDKHISGHNWVQMC
jgi:hypothetical protein